MILLSEVVKYIDGEIADMNRYINTNPYCDKPIESINCTESRCFGAVDFYIKMGGDFAKIDPIWYKYLTYFRERRNEVRENVRQKKRYDKETVERATETV